MALERNTMLCLALVAIGGAAVGIILYDTFIKNTITIEYGISEPSMQGDQYVAWYYFDMTNAPDGTKICYKGASENLWSTSTYYDHNEPLLRIKSMEPNLSDVLSLEFYGEADGYRFKFVCEYRP
jgi:hypothetical protein